MGSADGPSAGHALGQIVRNEMGDREGRERPRRGRGHDRSPQPTGGGRSRPDFLFTAWASAGLVGGTGRRLRVRGCARKSQRTRGLRHRAADQGEETRRRHERGLGVDGGEGSHPGLFPVLHLSVHAAPSCRADQCGEMEVPLREHLALDAAGAALEGVGEHG